MLHFLPNIHKEEILRNVYLRNIGFLVKTFSSWVKEGQHGINMPRRPQCLNLQPLFWVSGPKYGNQLQGPQKGKISSLFLPKFNWQYGISRMISLSIRRLWELNLCMWVFWFWGNGPKYEKWAPVHPKKVKFQFCPYQSFTDNKAFPKRSHRAY